MLTLAGMMTHTKVLQHNPRLQSLSQLEGEVVIVGGTFDPVHCGHIELALLIAGDEKRTVVFMPNGQNPLKPNAPKVRDDDRLKMLELALKEYPNCFVSDFEIQAGGKRYTVDTLEGIVKQAPKLTKLIYSMGADQIPRLHEWKNIERVFEIGNPKIVTRGGDPVVLDHLPKQLRYYIPNHIVEFNNPHSSTEVRQALARGDLEMVKAAVPPPVFDYIVQHRLYI